ncbi:MAG: hemin uptake protein HemP [Planctomycetota bacterium]
MHSTPNPGSDGQDVASRTSESMLSSDTDSPPESERSSGKSPSPALGASVEQAQRLPKIVNFDTLARCGDEIWIENAGQIYRLRRTKQGKLILTK